MMKLKNFLWLLLVCSLVSTAYSEPVHQKKLLKLATNAFCQKQIQNGNAADATPQDYRVVADGSDTLLLVVNFTDGFVVMSADNAITPVLAYSLDQHFDPDQVPAARMWLDYYADKVQEAKRLRLTPSEKVARQWSDLAALSSGKSEHEVVVTPLITALWNQTKYYNAYSPMDDDAPGGYDQRTPNGCVAVAMAMIMYYYRYPIHGAGSHTNYTDYGNFYVDFSQQTYFYEAMKDQLDYYNNEVAKLIFHCATSVDMMYAPDGSGAYSENVPYALSTYFGYDSSCEYLRRGDYSLSEWKNMLKEELDMQRPMYYSGCSDEGCHAFVCDGYDSNDYFHFNFGWGGTSNGYFILSASDSDDVVVGGYNHSQRVVRKIFPRTEYYPYYCSSEKIIKCQAGTLEDGSGIDNYQNNSSCTYVITEDSAYQVHIDIVSFETQQGHDSLSFWDGNPSQGRLLRTISGSIPSNTTYNFHTDSLYLVFNTDDSQTASGWRLKYQVDRYESSCQSNVIRDYRGTLTDGSGDLQYKSNANCYWRLNLPQASYITISFNAFDLGAGDYLTIYDRTMFPKTLLARYTGHNLPNQATFNANFISVEFYSDNYINGDGFELAWNSDYSPASIDNVETDALGIFPNPASDILYVRTPVDTRNVKLVLYNITGQQVKVVNSVDSNLTDVDVSGLPSGCYTAVLSTDKTSIRKKIIVQH